MDMLVREQASGRQQEQQCLVSGQRATLEQVARQQARQQAMTRRRRAALAAVGVILVAAALMLGSHSLGRVSASAWTGGASPALISWAPTA